MLVTFEIYSDGNSWCGRGIGVDIFTQGKTLDELMANIREAVGLHFEEELDKGESIRILTISETGAGTVARASGCQGKRSRQRLFRTGVSSCPVTGQSCATQVYYSSRGVRDSSELSYRGVTHHPSDKRQIPLSLLLLFTLSHSFSPVHDAEPAGSLYHRHPGKSRIPEKPVRVIYSPERCEP